MGVRRFIVCLLGLAVAAGGSAHLSEQPVSSAQHPDPIAAQMPTAIDTGRRSSIGQFQCSSIGAFIQILDNDKVSLLDLNSAVYTKMWDLHSSVTYMNAADIHPVDGRIYGISQVSGSTDYWLVRFDIDSLEFVAKQEATITDIKHKFSHHRHRWKFLGAPQCWSSDAPSSKT